jgi:hypothetical protein
MRILENKSRLKLFSIIMLCSVHFVIHSACSVKQLKDFALNYMVFAHQMNGFILPNAKTYTLHDPHCFIESCIMTDDSIYISVKTVSKGLFYLQRGKSKIPVYFRLFLPPLPEPSIYSEENGGIIDKISLEKLYGNSLLIKNKPIRDIDFNSKSKSWILNCYEVTLARNRKEIKSKIICGERLDLSDFVKYIQKGDSFVITLDNKSFYMLNSKADTVFCNIGNKFLLLNIE